MREPRLLIISEPRTGSNNIAYSLCAHPELEVGNELLHPINGIKVADYGWLHGRESISSSSSCHWVAALGGDERKRVIRSLFEVNNGFKVHTQHVPASVIMEIVKEFECKVILTRRLSIFHQALSNFIATAKGRWHADERVGSGEVVKGAIVINPGNFIAWIEMMLEIRRELWSELKGCQNKVIMLEYENFYSGNDAARVFKINELYRSVGVRKAGELEGDERSATYSKLSHYLNPQKQKMTDTNDIDSLVENYGELEMIYSSWLMAAYGKFLAL